MTATIVLMNNALRLDDNPALVAAMERGAPIVPVYVLDDDSAGDWKLGGARRWWLLQSLKQLSEKLKACGSQLIIRKGHYAEAVLELVTDVQADAIYMMRAYSPYELKTEAELHLKASDLCISCRRFAGNLLAEPEQVANKSGAPYKVFTPFWKQLRTLVSVPPLNSAPKELMAPGQFPRSDKVELLDLAPTPACWAEPIADVWQVGEDAAHACLRDFLEERVICYKRGRDIPGEDNTSRLSPYLANGEISARRIWQVAMDTAAANPGSTSAIEAFLREVAWREFSWHLLFHFPEMARQPLRPVFQNFPWRDGVDERVVRWQKGQTGFPIIDAGMRQLWQTGWMHNRVRMIVASFLVKDMLWHWHVGEDWFWDTLVDADIANNSASWQWVAGCGADAAPYFRIFNPILQGEKFDKAGDYVRAFVPELAKLPDAYIHKPFEASDELLKAAGITLGQDYPLPVVDRKQSRARALAAYETIKVAR